MKKLKHNKVGGIIDRLASSSTPAAQRLFIWLLSKGELQRGTCWTFACDVVSCDAEDIPKMLHSSCSDLPWASMVSKRKIACDVFEGESYI